MQEQDDLPAVRKTKSAHAGCKEAGQQLERTWSLLKMRRRDANNISHPTTAGTVELLARAKTRSRSAINMKYPRRRLGEISTKLKTKNVVITI